MKIFIKEKIGLTLILTLFFHLSLSAQFLKDLEKAVKGTVKTATKITTAPYESIANTAKVITGGGNIKQIYKPYTDASKQAGAAIGGMTNVISEPQRYLYQQANKFASQVGDEAEFVFDISTFVQRYSSDLAVSGAHATANILQGKDPFQVTALPLAAAVRSARDRFKDKAIPIPQELKIFLKGKLPDATINRAKYAVGKVEITLPNFVNNIVISNNSNHAVTVDDIIVFYRTPKSFFEDPCFWIHEMMHVEQYRKWGIERFAWKWLNKYPIEKEANQQGSAIAGRPCNNGNETSGGFAGGYSSPTYSQSLETYRSGHPTEWFMAQCHFARNPYPYYYLITNTRKIIAVHIRNGSRIHIGYAAAPFNMNFTWDFALFSNYRVGVTPDGRIWEPVHLRNGFGQFLYNPNGTPMLGSNVIGYVRQL
ncbi:hypothetical protein Q4Q35_10900 [Flavivirga aquimarina]|uniref:DUF4157 domain-containing protein n=1 Tax=Flavivirga aquimarina TaxID=2027862 RepID=A0ABT8WB91_9FLAO|nr:hypothetical protein [Flavivirga aquimarina]MDO5970314.1 hypothetical protein [Flavivirga aquimarina]